MRRYRVLESLRRICELAHATPQAPIPGETMGKIKLRLHMNNRSGHSLFDGKYHTARHTG